MKYLETACQYDIRIRSDVSVLEAIACILMHGGATVTTMLCFTWIRAYVTCKTKIETACIVLFLY